MFKEDRSEYMEENQPGLLMEAGRPVGRELPVAFSWMLAVGGEWSGLGTIWMVETTGLGDGSKVRCMKKEENKGERFFFTEQLGEHSCCLLR